LHRSINVHLQTSCIFITALVLAVIKVTLRSQLKITQLKITAPDTIPVRPFSWSVRRPPPRIRVLAIFALSELPPAIQRLGAGDETPKHERQRRSRSRAAIQRMIR
jgi:hypothetical protein